MKCCPACLLDRPVTDFGSNAKARDLLQWACRDCTNRLGRQRHASRSSDPAYVQRNRTYQVRRDRMKVHGLTVEEYERLCVAFSEAQAGRCAICQTENPRHHSGRFALDHDHKTGEQRGLLCHPCNRALGMFKDDPKILAAAINYLERHKRSNDLYDLAKETMP